jgi:hypothetical protein
MNDKEAAQKKKRFGHRAQRHPKRNPAFNRNVTDKWYRTVRTAQRSRSAAFGRVNWGLCPQTTLIRLDFRQGEP